MQFFLNTCKMKRPIWEIAKMANLANSKESKNYPVITFHGKVYSSFPQALPIKWQYLNIK